MMFSGVGRVFVKNLLFLVALFSCALSYAAAPTSPSNLTACRQADGKVRLTWQDNSSNEVIFWIFKNTKSDGTFNKFDDAPANSGPVASKAVSPNGASNLYYKVKAKNASGASGFSNFAFPSDLCAQPSPAPSARPSPSPFPTTSPTGGPILEREFNHVPYNARRYGNVFPFNGIFQGSGSIGNLFTEPVPIFEYDTDISDFWVFSTPISAGQYKVTLAATANTPRDRSIALNLEVYKQIRPGDLTLGRLDPNALPIQIDCNTHDTCTYSRTVTLPPMETFGVSIGFYFVDFIPMSYTFSVERLP